MGSQSTFTPRLVVIEGKDKGKVITLKDGTLVVGRSKGDILIQDPRISRSHVALNFDEKLGQLTVTDLKSLNGTQLNGEAIESSPIKDGDRLQLGNTIFDCQITQDSDEATVRAEKAVKKKKSSRAVEKELNEEESSLVPLRDTPKEPTALDTGVYDTDDSKEKNAVSLFGKLKRGFVKLPPRTQRYAMIGMVMIIVVFVFRNMGETKVSFVDEINAVRKLSSEGKTDQALEKVQLLSEQFPSHFESFFLMGDLYLNKKQNEQAILAYRKAHDLTPVPPMVHLRLIRAFLRSGLSQEAEVELKHLDEVIRKEGPHSKELFVEAAQIFLEFKELKQPPEKTFILAKALQNTLAPESTIGFKLEAQSLFQQNRSEEAVRALEHALQMDPTDEWIYENLAFSYLSMKDSPSAMAIAEKWRANHPESAKPLLVTAYLQFNQGNINETEPLVQSVIQRLASTPTQPEYAEALHLLGQVYIQKNQPDTAINYLRQACSLGFQQSCAQATAPTQGAEPHSPASVIEKGANAIEKSVDVQTGAESSASPGANQQAPRSPNNGNQDSKTLPQR